MKDQNRETQVFRHESLSSSVNNYCICRLLADLALVNIEAVTNLRTAQMRLRRLGPRNPGAHLGFNRQTRSEEDTSELQSPCNLLCRPLPGKKKNKAPLPRS